MDGLIYYISSKEIASRELKGEYLIFSGFSRETLVVHPLAFRLLQLLKAQPSTYHEIMEALDKDSDSFESDDLASFVSASLEQFIEFGIVDHNRD